MSRDLASASRAIVAAWRAVECNVWPGALTVLVGKGRFVIEQVDTVDKGWQLGVVSRVGTVGVGARLTRRGYRACADKIRRRQSSTPLLP